MSEFSFTRSQRVTVPAELAGAEGVQGIVSASTGFVGREPEYVLQWLVSEIADAIGRLEVCKGTVAESELLKAQPEKMVTADAAQKLISQSYLDGAQAQREQIAREAKREARRAAARKRKR